MPNKTINLSTIPVGSTHPDHPSWVRVKSESVLTIIFWHSRYGSIEFDTLELHETHRNEPDWDVFRDMTEAAQITYKTKGLRSHV